MQVVGCLTLYLFCIFCFHCVVLCTVCVSMCTVLLPPGVNPIAVNEYITHTQTHIYIYIYTHIYIYIFVAIRKLECTTYLRSVDPTEKINVESEIWTLRNTICFGTVMEQYFDFLSLQAYEHIRSLEFRSSEFQLNRRNSIQNYNDTRLFKKIR